MEKHNKDIHDSIERYKIRHGYTSFTPRAARIDMDGTLLDSMKWHTKAWHWMMTELGVECTREEFYLYEGMTGAATIDTLIRRAFGRPATPEEKTELYARKTGYFNEYPRVEIVKGAERMVRCLMENDITCVLVTGSGQPSNLARLDDDFPGGFPHDLRITSHSVTFGKPHPEPYLKAMALAKAAPWECIVIENAPLGVESGAKAGAFTIAVTTGPIPDKELWKAGADLVLPSMETLADLLPYILNEC